MNYLGELGGRQVEIVVKSAIPPELLLENVEASFNRNTPRFADMPKIGKDTRPIAIVGGGPSLRAELDNLNAFPGPVMGCGSVHDYLVGQGIYPDYHVVVDPCAVVVNWLKRPSPNVIYLIASQCHPNLFAVLDGQNVKLWHAFVVRDDGSKFVDFHGEPTIPGGDFVIGRAWPLAAVLGHRDIHFYGFDCSFPIECSSQHAYDYEWDREEPCYATVEHTKERFVTTPGWMAQLNTFMKMLAASAGQFTVTIHGDSLVSSMCCKS